MSRQATPYEVARGIVEGYGADVLTGTAPGISLLDMIEIAIVDRDKEWLGMIGKVAEREIRRARAERKRRQKRRRA